MFKAPFLLLLLAFSSEAVLEIPILSDIKELVEIVQAIGDIASGDVPFLFSSEDPVESKLTGLSSQIESLTNLFNVKLDNALSQILTNVPRETEFRIRMGQLGVYMARIGFLFKVYQRIIKSSHKLNQYTVEQFVDTATSLHDGDVIETLNQMHRLFTGRQDDDTQDSLIQLAAPAFKEMPISTLCGKTKSRQQRVFDLYRTVVVTEVKGFIMISYAYGLLGIFRNSSFAEETRKAEEELILRVSDYLAATKVGVASVPRDVYVCDPPVHKFDDTFVHMNRAIQLTVLQESMLRKKKCEGTCGNVDTSTIYRKHYDYPTGTYWEPKGPCKGRMTECRDLEKSDICEFGGDDSIERLVYVKSDELGIFGNSDRCHLGERSHLDTHIEGGFTIHSLRSCGPCMCLCVEEKKESNATRAFNLRPQVSDVDNNMVVTGISFAKEDNVIHLQIEQGKLIPGGKIEEGSAKWVRVDEFIYDPELSWQGGFKLWKNWEEHPLVDGEDYVFIHYDRRKIQFDDLVAKANDYVVTGAKLKVSKADPNAIALAVRFSRFNYTTGMLTNRTSDSIIGKFDNNNTKIHSVWTDDDFWSERRPSRSRISIDVTNKMDPFKTYGNFPNSPDHSEVKLTYSDERDDVGQSTIPYFDMQRSGPMPRVALDGIGMYLRRNDVSGGFVSFKTFTHDLSKYANPIIDPKSLRKEELKDLMEVKEDEKEAAVFV